MTTLADVLDVATASHTGMVRPHNEDSVYANSDSGVFILADGMGGYNAGEVASDMATSLLGSTLDDLFAVQPAYSDVSGGKYGEVVLVREISATNRSIYNAAQSNPQYAGMGTTLVASVFHDDAVTVAHIGDSRLYRFRNDALEQLTKDHSLLQEQIDGGIITKAQARHSQNKNLVTRALGVDLSVDTEMHTYPVLPGDLYLLCSDGLNDMIEDEEIAMALEALGANLSLCATHLVQMANDNGGRDNVSVILVRVKCVFPAPISALGAAGGAGNGEHGFWQRIWQRLRYWFR
ncbi:MAG TPA: Stp1/IreP family PP2C-type Ser/Thr phosphatase [Rhodocyclaceae bacterium]|nr:Stp1/IreP family PP2C-type Ser/Thr phosphatase [Rhodocyclaceae bacterium]